MQPMEQHERSHSTTHQHHTPKLLQHTTNIPQTPIASKAAVSSGCPLGNQCSYSYSHHYYSPPQSPQSDTMPFQGSTRKMRAAACRSEAQSSSNQTGCCKGVNAPGGSSLTAGMTVRAGLPRQQPGGAPRTRLTPTTHALIITSSTRPCCCPSPPHITLLPSWPAAAQLHHL
jgi:hypothetical protein